MFSPFTVPGPLLLLLAGELSLCIPLIPGTGSQHAGEVNNERRELNSDVSWHKYVRAPSSETVRPKGVVSGSVNGMVSHPEGLINGDSPTVLSRVNANDPIPSLVVDFGQNLAGSLNLKLNGSSDSTSAFPGLRLAFSETLQYLTERSDFTRSDNADDGDVRLSGDALRSVS